MRARTAVAARGPLPSNVRSPTFRWATCAASRATSRPALAAGRRHRDRLSSRRHLRRRRRITVLPRSKWWATRAAICVPPAPVTRYHPAAPVSLTTYQSTTGALSHNAVCKRPSAATGDQPTPSAGLPKPPSETRAAERTQLVSARGHRQRPRRHRPGLGGFLFPQNVLALLLALPSALSSLSANSSRSPVSANAPPTVLPSRSA